MFLRLQYLLAALLTLAPAAEPLLPVLALKAAPALLPEESLCGRQQASQSATWCDAWYRHTAFHATLHLPKKQGCQSWQTRLRPVHDQPGLQLCA